MCSLASRPYTQVEIGNLFVTQEQLYELKKALCVVKGVDLVITYTLLFCTAAYPGMRNKQVFEDCCKIPPPICWR
jgi:hypothetical protein